MTQERPPKNEFLAFVARQSSTRLKVVGGALKKAARSPRNEDAIHDARVAIRRFLQCMRLFGAFFDPGDEPARKRLKKVLKACGEVRNFDVALEILKDADVEDSDAARQLKTGRKEAQRRLAKRLRRWRKSRTAAKLRAGTQPVAQRGPAVADMEWHVEKSVLQNAHAALPSKCQEFFAKGRAAVRPGARYSQMHAFRLLAKRFRYTLEIFSPVFGDGLEKQIETLRGLQDTLGAMNDCVQTRKLLKPRGTLDRALRKLLREREQVFRNYWRQNFPSGTEEKWKQQLQQNHPAKKTS